MALLLCCASLLAAQPGLQPLFEQGLEAFKSGNFGSSELLFRKVIDSGPEGELRDKTWYYLALSIFNQKKYKAAIFEFNRFLLICTTQDLCVESRYWMAESYYFLKEYIRSIEEYKRFIAQSRNDLLIIAARDRIGDIYFQQRRYDEAIIEWREAINVSTNVHQNSSRMLKIGEALFLDEKYDEALHLLESVLSSRSDAVIEARARFFMARIYQAKNRHREALKALYGIPVTLFKEEPFYDVQYLKALSSIALGDNYSAKSFLESFLLIGKDSQYYYDAKYELGIILLRENNEREGAELLEEVRKSTRKMALRSRAALALSRVYLKRGPQEAIPYLEDAVSLEDPEEQKSALLLLSKAYIDVKRFDDAERILNLLLGNYPYDRENDLIQFLMARVVLDKNEPDRAIEMFARVIETSPSSVYAGESLYYMALAHMAKGENDKAAELIRRYLALPRAEEKYDASVRLLRLYLAMNDLPASERHMWTIIRTYPRQEKVEEVVYGFALELRGRGRAYEGFFQYIAANHPRSGSAGEVLLFWGDAAFQKKDYAAAERYYRQYLQTEGRKDAGSVFLYRAISLYSLGRYREVVSLISEGRVPPMDEYTGKQLRLWLGRSYFLIGNYEMAYKSLYTGNLKDNEPADLIMVMKSALEVGDIWTAQAAPARLVNDQELYGESLYLLGMYYLREGQHEAAFDFFAKASREASGSAFAERAKIEIAEIHVKEKRYSEAVEVLGGISDPALDDRKTALLIISWFGTGKTREAVELTNGSIGRLLNIPLGEAVVMENLLHYYRLKDLEKFNLYAGHLNRYTGNGPVINHLAGKLHFELGHYGTAYYYFYKLSQAESEYREEAYYLMGTISLVEQKNRNLAAGYFKKLSEIGRRDNPFVLRAKLSLSIILNEAGDVDGSKKVLTGMLTGSEGVAVKAQAENLWQHFGYSK